MRSSVYPVLAIGVSLFIGAILAPHPVAAQSQEEVPDWELVGTFCLQYEYEYHYEFDCYDVYSDGTWIYKYSPFPQAKLRWI